MLWNSGGSPGPNWRLASLRKVQNCMLKLFSFDLIFRLLFHPSHAQALGEPHQIWNAKKCVSYRMQKVRLLRYHKTPRPETLLSSSPPPPLVISSLMKSSVGLESLHTVLCHGADPRKSLPSKLSGYFLQRERWMFPPPPVVWSSAVILGAFPGPTWSWHPTSIPGDWSEETAKLQPEREGGE